MDHFLERDDTRCAHWTATSLDFELVWLLRMAFGSHLKMTVGIDLIRAADQNRSGKVLKLNSKLRWVNRAKL